MANSKPAGKSVPKKSSGKVFDVRRPGKTPAAPTSRPVIVGHKPEVQDNVARVSGVGDSRQLLNAKKKIEVKPLTPIEQTVQSASSASSVTNEPKKVMIGEPSSPPQEKIAEKDMAPLAAAVPVVSAKSQEPPVPSTQPEAPATAPIATQPKASSDNDNLGPDITTYHPGSWSVDVDDEKPSPALDASNPSSGAAPESKFNMQPIVVSHHATTSSAWKVLCLLLLIVLLAIIALDILLDAGILDTPNFPHTDFFANV